MNNLSSLDGEWRWLTQSTKAATHVQVSALLVNGLLHHPFPPVLLVAWLRRLPGYLVGGLGAYWAIERMVAGGEFPPKRRESVIR
jgi:hypothetical protein